MLSIGIVPISPLLSLLPLMELLSASSYYRITTGT